MVKRYRTDAGWRGGARAESQYDYYQGEELMVNCWCETRPVLVPRDELKNGLTRPCSSEKCITMSKQKGGFVPESRGVRYVNKNRM